MEKRLEKLQYMFDPRSVAFVGATEKVGKWGFIIFNNLITGDYGGKLYPVTPSRGEVLGYRAYPSVVDIPDEIDLAVIAAPAAATPAAIDDCVKKGVPAVCGISAGFKEMGGEGAAMEAKMARKVRAAGMVMVGPNGQGVCGPSARLYAWMPHFFYPPPGPVAVISQSGNVQGLMINALLEVGVGVSRGVSSGNEADLKTEDYFAWLAEDPETSVILSYIEGVENGRRFLEIARETVKKKPIVLLKGGQTEHGAAAAKSHTGSMAVSSELFEAACAQAGITRARTIFESAILAASFVNRPLPKGRRVGIVTGGGGLGVIASDLCARAGLVAPRFSEDTIAKIAAKMPPWWVPGNPIDLVAGLNFQVVPSILETIMSSGEIDLLLLLFLGPKGLSHEEIKPRNPQTEKMMATWKTMRAMAHGFGGLLSLLMKKTGVPVLAVSDFGNDTPEAKKLKFASGYSIFHPDIETACAAAAAMARHFEVKAGK